MAKDSRTQLTDAIRNNDAEEIKRLARDDNSIINALDENKKLPLVQAAWWGKDKAIEALLKSGAEVNNKDGKGTTALKAAAATGNEGIIEVLLRERADVNLTDKNGSTPLIAAAMKNNGKVATLLLAKGAAIDAQNNKGETALTKAVNLGYPDIVEILLGKGADARLAAEDKTPLDIAQEKLNQAAGEENKQKYNTIIDLLKKVPQGLDIKGECGDAEPVDLSSGEGGSSSLGELVGQQPGSAIVEEGQYVSAVGQEGSSGSGYVDG